MNGECPSAIATYLHEVDAENRAVKERKDSLTFIDVIESEIK